MPLQQDNNSKSNILRVLTAVIDGMKLPAYVVGFDTQELLYINKAFIEAYGDRYDAELERWNVMWPGMSGASPFCGHDKLVDENGEPTDTVNSHDFFDQSDLRWYQLTESLIEWADGRKAVLMTREDITEQKDHERRLTERAYVDALTGAYNQQYLSDGMLKLCEGIQSCGVMAMDVRSFKNINESFGHDFGDKVLVSIAHMLRQLVPFTPLMRVSSNEFVFVLENIGLEDMKSVSEGVLSCFFEPLRVETQELYIDFCIGIAYAETTAPDIPALFRDADIALYYAKKGPHKMYVLTDELRDSFNSRVSTELELRRAIERSEFEVYYQPKVQVKDRKVHGAEALIRWNHPERGVVSPLYFIPVAEETGLILQIGEFVIAEVARQLREWKDEGIDVFVAINASVRQFLSVDFTSTIQRWLDAYSLPHELMIVEVTESIVAGDINRVTSILENLRSDGIRVSLDDFGTGYSSLNYLVQMPLDDLKIDKSFIDNASTEKKNEVILETIITMAHDLGLSVTAEGVEQEEQVALLEEFGCDLIQGYYFSRPLRAAGFAGFYRENLREVELRDGAPDENAAHDVARQTFFMRVDRAGFEFIDNMPMACSAWNDRREMLYCNREFLKSLGVASFEELDGQFHKFSPERQADGRLSGEVIDGHIMRALETGCDEFDWIHLNAQGEPVTARASLRRIPYGESFVVVAYMKFAREYESLFDKKRAEDERIRIILENAPMACHYRDSNYNVIDCNSAMLDMLGIRTKAEYLADPDMFRPDCQPDGESSHKKSRKHFTSVRRQGMSRFEWMMQDNGGDAVPCEVTMFYTLHGDDEIYVSYIRDLRDVRRDLQALNHLEYLANTDPLTGAHNRRSFDKMAETMFAAPDSLFLFMLDLDLFKRVNDDNGHQAGDEVLRQVTHNIQMMLRKTDVFSRYGGEEFTILAQELNRETAALLAERIRNVLEKTPVVINNMKIYQTVSMGIAERTPEVGDVETLLENADKALYEAKASGRNRVVFFRNNQGR